MSKYSIQFLSKIIGLAVLLAALNTLTACATPGRGNYMTVSKSDLNQKLIKKTSRYDNNICLGTIDGGKKTNPLWVSKVDNDAFKVALENSLINLDLYNPNKNSRYILNANLEKLKQPLVGLDLTVTCQSRYQVYDQQLKKIVFEKTLSSPYTASFSSAFLAAERLKAANEGAVKESIKDLVKELYSS